MKSKTDENAKKDRIDEIFSDEKQITATLQRAVRQAVQEHRRAGNPVAAWKNGKVVIIETK